MTPPYVSSVKKGVLLYLNWSSICRGCVAMEQSAALLRLLPTFAGGLQEKNRTCAGFNKIPTNYISEESLIKGVYDKSIV